MAVPLIPASFVPSVELISGLGGAKSASKDADTFKHMSLHGCTSIRYWPRARRHTRRTASGAATHAATDETDDCLLITDHSSDRIVCFNLQTGKAETLFGQYMPGHMRGGSANVTGYAAADEWVDATKIGLTGPSGVDVWAGDDLTAAGSDNPFVRADPADKSDPATRSGALVVEYFSGAMYHVRSGMARAIPRPVSGDKEQWKYDVKVTRDGRFGYVSNYSKHMVERVDLQTRVVITVVGGTGTPIVHTPLMPAEAGIGLSGGVLYDPKSVSILSPRGLCWIEPSAREPTPESILCICSKGQIVWYYLPRSPRAVLAAWTDAGITRDILLPELWAIVSAYSAGLEAAELIPFNGGRANSHSDDDSVFDEPTGVACTSGGMLLLCDSRNDAFAAVDPRDGRTAMLVKFNSHLSESGRAKTHSVCVVESRGCCYVSDLGQSRIWRVALPQSFFGPPAPGPGKSGDPVPNLSKSKKQK